MDQIAPAFFYRRTVDTHLLDEVKTLLQIMLPEPLLLQYHALTSDFFAWLNE